MAPTNVFVAGSRKISRLPAAVKQRIDTIIDKGFQILVGDANGADRAFQQYLADKAYRNVLVHCMENGCRNNVGQWPSRQIEAPRGSRGFDYYSIKDTAMSEVAEFGLMLWDGRSKGTINNIVNLSRRRRPVVVYVAPKKSFQTVRSMKNLLEILAKGDPKCVERLADELNLSIPTGSIACVAAGTASVQMKEPPHSQHTSRHSALVPHDA
ncbi:MAG: hypothetical protein OXC19_17560 [Bryobacterales bacterium]|nr:hypothetical protein [Bryobacterales bacterium]